MPAGNSSHKGKIVEVGPQKRVARLLRLCCLDTFMFAVVLGAVTAYQRLQWAELAQPRQTCVRNCVSVLSVLIVWLAYLWQGFKQLDTVLANDT